MLLIQIVLALKDSGSEAMMSLNQSFYLDSRLVSSVVPCSE